MDMGIGMPLTVVPPTMKMGVGAMVYVRRMMTAMVVVVVIVISPTTVCLRRKR